ncbi:RagB/SusD family nutrient uptake outer membrane protein [Persicobacter diffluens]|uniref:Membrane protein n=1 Tax=Persicobacter diffluens TaxID=981 RepID=A0AAN4W1H7_9BACT|nr:membrane protein [Persicobacter diffluens]
MKKNKISLLLLAFMLQLAACNFLDLDPVDRVDEETYFQNRDEAYLALLGAYEPLRSDRTVALNNILGMSADIMSDDAYAGGGSVTDNYPLQNAGRFMNNPADQGVVQGFWKKCYRGIARVNLLLDKYPEINWKPSEQQDSLNFAAEATFLRAHYHFELLRWYENIPVVQQVLDATNWRGITQLDPAQAYALVADDILEAIPHMMDQVPQSEQGRLSQWAAKAELLKVFQFYTGVYQKNSLPVAGGNDFTLADAIAMAEEIIHESGHDLLADYAAVFDADSDFNNEVLFEIPFFDRGGATPGADNHLGNFQCQMSGPRGYNSDLLRAGYGFNIPTHSLYNAFEDSDPRRAVAIVTAEELLTRESATPNLEAGFTHTGMYAYKYTTHADRFPSAAPVQNWSQNFHYIRFADVLLMAAELHLNNGNQGKALEYTNRVRNRVNLPSMTSVDLEDIYQERRVELALEGWRYFDLLRRGVDYADQHLTVTNYQMQAPSIPDLPQTGDVGNPQDFEVTFDKVKRGFLPIPLNELDLNNNLVQNAGY